ncbi:MAG TPA: hypothetical protein VF747_11705 [Blastocatellia bacterium]|jgi:hypothetical protein
MATAKPLPAFVKRISNADVAHGDTVGALNVWPSSRPVVTVEQGERLMVSLRVRTADGGGLKLSAAGDSYKLRPEANANGYWLDIPIEPATDSSPRVIPIVVQASDPPGDLNLQLTVNVQSENLFTTPRQLDFGEVSLADLKSGSVKVGRVGIRKLVGAFHIKAISSSLVFLKLEQQAMVEGSNYLIRARIDASKLPKAGTYTGVLQVETDDAQFPRLEVPVKIVFKQ